jgi:hypothetical protein
MPIAEGIVLLNSDDCKKAKSTFDGLSQDWKRDLEFKKGTVNLVDDDEVHQSRSGKQ